MHRDHSTRLLNITSSQRNIFQGDNQQTISYSQFSLPAAKNDGVYDYPENGDDEKNDAEKMRYG